MATLGAAADGQQGSSEDERFVREAMLLPSETRSIEFKAAKEQYSFDKAVEYCAALANEGGGSLLLGISDRLPRAVVGTRAFQNTQKTEGDIYDALRLRAEVIELSLDGLRVVRIKIGSRPTGQPVMAPGGRYLMRQGERLVDMTPDQLRAIFTETQPPFLESPATEAWLPSEVEEAIAVASYFRMAKSPEPGDAAARCKALAAVGLLISEEGQYRVTGLAVALFARKLSDFNNMNGRQLRFLEYEAGTNTSVRREYLADGGYACEFGTFLNAVNSAIPIDERIEGAVRNSVPLYHPVAVRELVANAIAHQNFAATPSFLSVELFADRLEITNPGKSLIEPTRFPSETKPRNPKLTMMMKQLGMCEARGSGIQRILENNEAVQLSDPQFRTSETSTTSIVQGVRDFMLMTADERNWAIFMHSCRMWGEHKPMTNASFRARYDLADSKSSLVSLHLQQVLEARLIRNYDATTSSRRYARYIPFFA